jgi:hypothetical protein
MTAVDLDGIGGDVLLTVDETMRLLRLRSRNTLVKWEREGHLRPVHIGRPDAVHRTLRYRRDEAEALARGSHE